MNTNEIRTQVWAELDALRAHLDTLVDARSLETRKIEAMDNDITSLRVTLEDMFAYSNLESTVVLARTVARQADELGMRDRANRLRLLMNMLAGCAQSKGIRRYS